VDILVNNAGGSRNAGVLDMTDDDWEFTINTDLTSVFKVTRAFGKYMVERRYGRIINIASIFGQVGNTAINTMHTILLKAELSTLQGPLQRNSQNTTLLAMPSAPAILKLS